jgi:hypothetical protein
VVDKRGAKAKCRPVRSPRQYCSQVPFTLKYFRSVQVITSAHFARGVSFFRMQNLIIGVILIALSIWVVSALPRIMQMTTLPANMGTSFNVPSLVGPATTTAPTVVPAPAPVVQSPVSSAPPRTTGTLLGQLACAGCPAIVEIYSPQGVRMTVSPNGQGAFRAELAPGDYVAQVANGAYADAKGFHIAAGAATSIVLGR